MTNGNQHRFIYIIELLRSGMIEGRIRWQEIPPGSENIVVVLTNFRVVLTRETVEDNIILSLKIQNNLGHPIGSLFASFNYNESLFDTLSQLHTDALTQYRNLDGALDEIEQELSSDGAIGREPEQEQTSS